MEDEKNVGDEFVEDTEIEEKEEKGYDLVIPPGMPYKIITEAAEKFNLEITVRRCALKTIDIDSENLLVLRGELESVNNAHDYIYQKLKERYNYNK